MMTSNKLNDRSNRSAFSWLAIVLAGILAFGLFGTVGCASKAEDQNAGDATAADQPAEGDQDDSNQETPADQKVEGVAATIDGHEITEQEVADYVKEMRNYDGMTSERDWGIWLATNGFTPETLRTDIIQGFVSDYIFEKACKDNGIEVPQETIDKTLQDTIKEYGSEDEFKAALDESDMTQDEYVEYYVKPELEEEALVKKVAGSTDDDAWIEFDEWYAEYEESLGEPTINPMPEGLPYAIDMAPYDKMLEDGEIQRVPEDDLFGLEGEDGEEIDLSDLDLGDIDMEDIEVIDEGAEEA